jgi:translation initiation factor IF-2
MTETRNTGDKTITVAPKKKLGLKRGNIERDTVRQSFSHGRTNTVQVERKKRRVVMPGEAKPETVQARQAPEPVAAAQPEPVLEEAYAGAPRGGLVLRQLSDDEIDARAKALAEARVREAEERKTAEEHAARRVAEAARLAKEREEPRRRRAPAPKTLHADGSAKKRRRRPMPSWLAAFARQRKRPRRTRSAPAPCAAGSRPRPRLNRSR